jgi:hypothetical protein
VIDDQDILRLLLDTAGDTLSMPRSEQQCPEDEQVQRALKVGRVFPISALTYRHSTQVSAWLGLNVHLKVTGFAGDLDIELMSMDVIPANGRLDFLRKAGGGLLRDADNTSIEERYVNTSALLVRDRGRNLESTATRSLDRPISGTKDFIAVPSFRHVSLSRVRIFRAG